MGVATTMGLLSDLHLCRCLFHVSAVAVLSIFVSQWGLLSDMCFFLVSLVAVLLIFLFLRFAHIFSRVGRMCAFPKKKYDSSG